MKYYCVNKSFLKKKDGCRFCVNKKKDGCLLRQQTRRSAVWADLTKQIFQVVTRSRKFTSICTSNLQVFVSLQVEFTSAFECSYKCSFSNSNF
jgi:hypothetical protein